MAYGGSYLTHSQERCLHVWTKRSESSTAAADSAAVPRMLAKGSSGALQSWEKPSSSSAVGGGTRKVKETACTRPVGMAQP
eukprot:CAMPEP_0119368122 /NCGR_PEP_ID=MMETSP1334-20130426/14820_1 /TAXON_ID=127549 /ORGANISM="Calcidiscus leptoporus, Strain RCC1130" /LENGTH=80 /DNA_ID=CAMNT_0007384693 /DNA_START=144 /DNA_END=382 /DNA_ORIENTATION=-